MEMVIGAYWIEYERNGERSIIGELPGDVCEESGWKGLKLKNAKSLSELEDILPCPDLATAINDLKADTDLDEVQLCRVFHFFIEYDYVDSHSYNFETGKYDDPKDLDSAPWTDYGDDLSFLTDWYDGDDWAIIE